MKIAIIGCGNMGAGLACRLSEAEEVIVFDRNPAKVEALVKKGCGLGCASVQEAIQSAEVVILAIKPQNFNESAATITPYLKPEQLFISLLAGTSLITLKKAFPGISIVRMMPNLALVYGDGVIGLTAEDGLSQKWRTWLNHSFARLGKILWLSEKKLDAIASLAGSGPAFIFVLIEACIDAGIALGFTAKESRDIVLQMIQGSLTLLNKSEKHPGELKWQITSPGGTTIAGLKKMEELAVRGAMINTFLATHERLEILRQQGH